MFIDSPFIYNITQWFLNYLRFHWLLVRNFRMTHLMTQELEPLRLTRDLRFASNDIRGGIVPGIRVTAWENICETGDNRKLQLKCVKGWFKLF